MSQTGDQPPEVTPPYVESGRYEYSYDKVAHNLQIYSARGMQSTYHDAQETLDLLRFLLSHQTDIEEAARQQAAQKPRQKTTEERIDGLFH